MAWLSPSPSPSPLCGWAVPPAQLGVAPPQTSCTVCIVTELGSTLDISRPAVTTQAKEPRRCNSM